jgi:predicted ATP-grasp superfamily ATP-dependent carboligase
MKEGSKGDEAAGDALWLLVGLSVRPLAEAAAAAGHAVCAIDAFADRETLAACAGRAVKLSLCRDWHIGAARLAGAIDEARRRHAPHGFAGVTACSGIEAEPELLELLADAAPLLGNHRGAIDAVRRPANWFPLLQSVGAPHPAVSFCPPPQRRGWLLKSADGSGGRQVRQWNGDRDVAANAYFQRRKPGRPASALFVADGQRARIIGWQWQILAPGDDMPWRYGGVVTAMDMAPAVRERVAGLVDAIVAQAGLRGLCGLDFLVDGNRLQFLELNPRPTASVALYPQMDVFALHRGACAGRLPATTDAFESGPAVGEAVLYAPLPLRVAAEHPWPDWCRDVAPGAGEFVRGQPVCSVRAAAETPAGVRVALARRLHNLSTELEENFADGPVPQQRQCARRTARPIPAV